MHDINATISNALPKNILKQVLKDSLLSLGAYSSKLSVLDLSIKLSSSAC